eukprot:4666974-Prorocentrum_lima.AAC.1
MEGGGHAAGHVRRPPRQNHGPVVSLALATGQVGNTKDTACAALTLCCQTTLGCPTCGSPARCPSPSPVPQARRR